MFIHYRTQGIIIEKEDRGEADQLLTIYTKDFGKLEILGKAIRKISSKLRSGVDLFYLSEIEFIQGKTYRTLTDSILIEKFEQIRTDLKRLKIAHNISDFLDKLVNFQEQDEKIWQLLNESFKKLKDCSLLTVNCSLIYYYFFWRLLSILGYQPEIYHCPSCQRKLIPEKLYFSPKEGGVICQNCFKEKKSGKEIKTETIKILRVIFEGNWQILLKLKMNQTYLNSIKDISEEYLSLIMKNYEK